MSEFNPLVQRVDALLKRHQQATGTAAAADVQDHEAARIEVQNTMPDPALSMSGARAEAQPGGNDEDVPVLTEIVDPAAMPALPQDFDPAALGAQIEAAVLEKVLSELDQALDQRLGRTIGDLLERVLDGLRAELSVSVRQIVREAVATSVAREIAERSRHPK